MINPVRFVLGLFLLGSVVAIADPVISMPAALVLAPDDGNPRNSEGDFIALKDGRILFVYTHFTDGAGDHATAHLAGRYSADGGSSWSDKDHVVLENEGDFNIMSVSLLRLQDDSIALLYLKKNSTDDCIPLIRFSIDEAKSWSEPITCITDPIGYYVVNNDRLVQLKSGRLIIPASRHALKGEEFGGRGTGMCVLSDDNGRNWRLSKDEIVAPVEIKTGLQEPGVIELKDGRLLLWARTSGGSQYQSYSGDGGETWTAPEPSGLISPVSPATIERIPGSGTLLLVWNDHSDVTESRAGKRTPLRAAVSKDEGATWHVFKTLEDLASGWYCYIAMDFTEEGVLLGYCAGDREEGNGLDTTKLTVLTFDNLPSDFSTLPQFHLKP